MRHTVNAVLFDLDNTLADRDLAFAAWARWFARERLGFTDDATIDDTVAVLTILDAKGHAPKDAMFRTLKDQHTGLTETVETLVAAFREQLRTHLPPLNDGAARLLAALDLAGIPWGIVSNGSRGQLLKIRTLGLDTRAGCIVVSDEVGLRKPDPAIFLVAAERLDIVPANALFVGDNAEADIVGAASAGMQTAWLHRGQAWPDHVASVPAHFVIDSLAELLWVAECRARATPQLLPG